MEEYWPNGCLPVVCGFNSTEHQAFKLALLDCLDESKVGGCNGTSVESSLVDKTINVVCDISSKDSAPFDNVNSTNTTTPMVLATAPGSSDLSAQWTSISTSDNDGSGQDSIGPLSTRPGLSPTTAAGTGIPGSNLSSIVVSIPIRNSSFPTSIYMGNPPLPTLPGTGLNNSTETVAASTIYSTHVITLSTNDTPLPSTTAPNSETSLSTTSVVTASSAPVSSSGNAASSVKMVMRSDLWYLFESIVGLGIYVAVRGEWDLF
ncbi:hypothetical protein LTS17_007023 [Exophiala oligosperma]